MRREIIKRILVLLLVPAFPLALTFLLLPASVSLSKMPVLADLRPLLHGYL